MSQIKNSTIIRHDIQGLRAIAVLSVIVFHANSNWLPGGYIGVDIFFVISGFLIASIIKRNINDNNFSFLTFYKKRLLRIVPAYYSMIGVVSLFASILFIPKDFTFFQSSLIESIIFTSNTFFSNFGDYFGPSVHEMPLLHTWSLSIEIQFYLFAPFIIILTPKRYFTETLFFLSLIIALYASYNMLLNGQKQSAYFQLLPRIAEFLIGVRAANIKTTKKPLTQVFLSFFGAVLLALSITMIHDGFSYPGLWSLVPCLATSLILQTSESPLNKLLSSKILSWIGTLSYSLYLWHWPILAFLRYFTESYHLTLLSLLSALVITFLLSIISYKYVERPFITSSSNLQLRWIFVISPILLSLLFIGPMINLKSSPAVSESLLRYAKPNEICHGNVASSCIIGDSIKPISILLIGDSHAAQLFYFSKVVAKYNDVNVKLISASSCIPLPFFEADAIPSHSRSDCLNQIEYAKNHVDSADILIIAAKWQVHWKEPYFQNSLKHFFKKHNNKTILILSQVPRINKNVERLSRFSQFGLVNFQEGAFYKVKENNALDALSRKFPGVFFLDFTDEALFSKPPIYNDTLIYFDDHHINEFGSNLYGELAAPKLSYYLNLKTK